MIDYKRQTAYNTFGDFISVKRHEREIPAQQMAETLGLSPGYYCDIEKGRRKPPERALLQKLIETLRLSSEDICTFYDLAGKARSEAPPDLPEYINENQVVRVALRLAKDKGSTDDWQRFIFDLENRQIEGG
ncbi:MAG: helix-turn-helix transcriptional regulator [Clostridiales bacterium]|nr:helix-turn-helix transcriptional regulator [Clostridiales bacterium]